MTRPFGVAIAIYLIVAGIAMTAAFVKGERPQPSPGMLGYTHAG